MNKSDIMKAAELGKALLETRGACNSEMVFDRFIPALCAAAELLKQVEVLPEGSEPMVGDVVFCSVAQMAYIVTNEGLTKIAEDNLMQIITRSGKPVITVNKEVV